MKLKISLVLATLVTGGLFYGFSGLPVVACELAKLEAHASDLASVYSSYAFTVAGFLATISTFLYTLGGKPYFEFYKRRGSFGDLMFFHVLAMLVLGALFIVSVFMHSHPGLVRLASVLTALSLVKLTLLVFISFALSNRAQ